MQDNNNNYSRIVWTDVSLGDDYYHVLFKGYCHSRHQGTYTYICVYRVRTKTLWGNTCDTRREYTYTAVINNTLHDDESLIIVTGKSAAFKK